MSGAGLHYGDPWAGPPEARDPLRRLRGHLVMPVTVWLAPTPATGEDLVGLTVSSVLMSAGEPAMLAGVIAPTSELADAVATGPGRFVVHVLGSQHRRLALHFAGVTPAPSEMLAHRTSLHGPLLDIVADRALCRTASVKAFGWSLLVEAQVEAVEVGRAGEALAWYHAEFRVLAPRD
ncbi:MAG TPA: flavin reductase [Acidimicrobiales bacterium]|nr:flavin reductase [Acidimicrobiales bacterium]